MALAAAAAAQSNSTLTALAPAPVKLAATDDRRTVPPGQSPVAFFRKLLQVSPADRNQLLASRAPLSRARILAKVREYEALDSEERESRLQATELRWYLVPLMSAAPADRAGKLARVPSDLLPLVKSRLMLWDVLPPLLKQEFLANERTPGYFAQPPRSRADNGQSDKIADRFSWLFTLTPEEKQRALDTLSAPERAQMEKTLKSFDNLPAQQRLLCVRNYAKFAGMSEADRAEFLKNADSWSKMSAEERQTWRDLVASVPVWPPMPSIIPIMPPPLPFAPNDATGRMATNN
jgi:hypothetical protein